MGSAFDAILDRYNLASSEFRRSLEMVRADQWAWPTPCTEWNVRQLVNHMTRGNLNFVGLLNGATGAWSPAGKEAPGLVDGGSAEDGG